MINCETVAADSQKVEFNKTTHISLDGSCSSYAMIDLPKVKYKTDLIITISNVNVKINTLNGSLEDFYNYSLKINWCEYDAYEEKEQILDSYGGTFKTWMQSEMDDFSVDILQKEVNDTSIEHFSFDIIIVPKIQQDTSIKLNKSTVNMTVNSCITLKASLKNIKEYDIKWKSSNNKLVDIEENPEDDRKLTVWTNNKTGTCKITCYYGRYKATCRIKIAHSKKMKIECVDWGYDTRNNYFCYKFRNDSYYPVFFLNTKSKIIDSDYQSFDRIVKLKKVVKIAPGQTKWLKYKVLGRLTWYKIDDFELITKARYNKKLRKFIFDL